MRRPVPRRLLGHRRPRRGPPRGLAPRLPRQAGGHHAASGIAAGTVRLSSGDARDLKHARYALWKNPENLTGRQEAKLAWIEKTHPYLWRAYLLKGRHLRTSVPGSKANRRQGRPDPLADPGRPAAASPNSPNSAKKIPRHLPSIHATLDHGLSNGLIESVNTKIRVLTRIAYGFHKPAALIALAMLALGGLRPPLPGR